MGERRLPADNLRHHVRDQRRVRLQLAVLLGELVERVETAGDGVTRRVVAADDEEDQVSEILHLVHVPGRLAMRQHGDEIVARLARIHPLVPETDEIIGAFEKFRAARFFRFDDNGILGRGGHIRPASELAAFLEGEVEKRGEHLRREFDRDAVHPVEGLVLGQFIENAAGAFADRTFELGEVRRRDDGAHHLALVVMLGRVHRNEHGELEVLVLVAERYSALGGKDLVVGIHRHDVLVARNRPIGACVLIGGAVVDRRFVPEALEIGPHGVVLEEVRIGDVIRLQRSRIGCVARFVGLIFNRCVAHRVCFRLSFCSVASSITENADLSYVK